MSPDATRRAASHAPALTPSTLPNALQTSGFAEARNGPVDPRGEICARRVALWGIVGYKVPQRTGVEGLLPLLHLGPPRTSRARTRDPMAFRGTFDYSLDAKNRLTVPAKFRASLAEGVVLAKGIERCVQLWTPRGFEHYTGAALQGVHPLSDESRKLTRFFSANSLDTEL